MNSSQLSLFLLQTITQTVDKVFVKVYKIQEEKHYKVKIPFSLPYSSPMSLLKGKHSEIDVYPSVLMYIFDFLKCVHWIMLYIISFNEISEDLS